MAQYTFLRHAEAANHNADHERPLSQAGEAQANTCNLSAYPCDLILTSSALRAVQTAERIRANHYPDIPLEHVKELYLPQTKLDSQTVLKMLSEQESANLTQLLARDREGAWRRYCQEAYDALTKAVEKHHAHDILVVAHANIINDLALRIAPEAEELRSLYFAPCTGFRIDAHRTIEYIF